MTSPKMTSHGLVIAAAVMGLILVAGCKRPGSQPQPNDAAKAARPTEPFRPAPTEQVSELEETLQVQPARTTSNASVPLPWNTPTPTTSADARTVQPARVWSAPAILIGRTQVWLGDKALIPIHCVSKRPEDCAPEALKQPSAIATFGFLAAEISEGKVPALAAAIADLKDKDVPVIADRRVNWQAVDAVMTSLRAAGARPLLTAGSHEGNLVDILGVGTALPEAPTLVAARRAADPGESAPGGLPTDATSITVFVTATGVSVEVARAAGEPAYPEVMGNLVESLIALSERVRLAAPQIQSITIRADGDATFEQVVQVVDGVRDTCGKTARGQHCAVRTALFTTIKLESNVPAPAAVKVGLDVPLHLDAPSPSGLHLSDSPDPLAKPAAPGLHLTP